MCRLLFHRPHQRHARHHLQQVQRRRRLPLHHVSSLRSHSISRGQRPEARELTTKSLNTRAALLFFRALLVSGTAQTRRLVDCEALRCSAVVD